MKLTPTNLKLAMLVRKESVRIELFYNACRVLVLRVLSKLF
jgi:hypothetical protein